MKKINIINEKNNLLKEYFIKGELNHKVSYSFLNLLNDVEEKTEERLVSILENGIIFNEDHTQYMRSSINYTMEGDRLIMILLGDIDTPKHITFKSTFASNSVNYDYEDAICFIVNRANSDDYYIVSDSHYNVVAASDTIILASMLFEDESNYVKKETKRLYELMELDKLHLIKHAEYIGLQENILKYFLRYIDSSNTSFDIDDYKSKPDTAIANVNYDRKLIEDILDVLNTDIVSFVFLTKEEIIHKIQSSALNKSLPSSLASKLYIRNILYIYSINHYINNKNSSPLIFSIEEILKIQYSFKNIISDAGRLSTLMHFINNPKIVNVRVEAEDIDSGKIIKGSASALELLSHNTVSIDDKYYSYKDIEILSVSYRKTTYKTETMEPISKKVSILCDSELEDV